MVLVGNQRSFLAALVTAQPSNGLKAERIQSALDAANAGLPHYKTIRAFHVVPEPFTIENGMLTANGKAQTRRDRRRGLPPKSKRSTRRNRHEEIFTARPFPGMQRTALSSWCSIARHAMRSARRRSSSLSKFVSALESLQKDATH